MIHKSAYIPGARFYFRKIKRNSKKHYTQKCTESHMGLVFTDRGMSFRRLAFIVACPAQRVSLSAPRNSYSRVIPSVDFPGANWPDMQEQQAFLLEARDNEGAGPAFANTGFLIFTWYLINGDHRT